jgi:hypothetical protein
MDINENTIGYQELNGQIENGEAGLSPVVIYSLGFDAEELLTVYAGLRTYLKALAGRETEDLEQIARATKLLIALRPRAIRASKEVSLKIDSGSNPA